MLDFKEYRKKISKLSGEERKKKTGSIRNVVKRKSLISKWQKK